MPATPDFSQIWGVNSPLTPYPFSTQEYASGWAFLGEQAPEMEMFDAYFASVDTRLKYLSDNLTNPVNLAALITAHNSSATSHDDIRKMITDGLANKADINFVANKLAGLVTGTDFALALAKKADLSALQSALLGKADVAALGAYALKTELTAHNAAQDAHADIRAAITAIQTTSGVTMAQVTKAVGDHNIAAAAHADIRAAITALQNNAGVTQAQLNSAIVTHNTNPAAHDTLVTGLTTQFKSDLALKEDKTVVTTLTTRVATLEAAPSAANMVWGTPFVFYNPADGDVSAKMPVPRAAKVKSIVAYTQGTPTAAFTIVLKNKSGTAIGSLPVPANTTGVDVYDLPTAAQVVLAARDFVTFTVTGAGASACLVTAVAEVVNG